MTVPTKTQAQHTLTVPTPERGWLSVLWPEDVAQRVARSNAFWAEAGASIRAAGLPRLGRVIVRATFRPRHVANRGEVGLHVADDLHPSWLPVKEALLEAGIEVFREKLLLRACGKSMDPFLLVEMWEWGVPHVR